MWIPDGQRPSPAGTALIGKAFRVLRQVSRRHHAGSTLMEIAQACALHHATALRILRALQAEEMVALRPGTRHYVLGPGAVAFGAAVHPAFDLRRLVDESVRRIARATGGNGFFNVRSGYDGVYIARETAVSRTHALPLEVGARRPLIGTAGGVALLLHLGAREQAAALRYGLRQIAPIGAQRRNAVTLLVRRSRRRGFGINEDLIVPGMTGVGVAVGPPGAPVGALSCTMVSERARERGMPAISALLHEEAHSLGIALQREGITTPHTQPAR